MHLEERSPSVPQVVMTWIGPRAAGFLKVVARGPKGGLLSVREQKVSWIHSLLDET
jgi:hypothetical protein